MKKSVIIAIVLAAGVAGIAYLSGMFEREATATGQEAAAQAGRQGGSFPGGGFPGGGGFRGGGRGGQGRQPLTVELGTVRRATINEEITVVGNLIGATTVAVAPRAAGRLQEVYVRLGDRVTRGQRIAKIEDFELQEQINQAEAAQQVSLATIRQRESDLQLAKISADRSRSLFERQLVAKQVLDDAEARYQAAQAQLDLARAQSQQSKARLDELRINLANTVITSPVNGFIARRAVDPGASVGQNAPVVDVVDISSVRLVVNVVERDLKQLQGGDPTRVQVDAYPGEIFSGRIARVSPVLDPATRTAPIEIEIPNPDFRLKPGMYARVGITMDTKKDALLVPSQAMADLGGRRGVFQVVNNTAVFRAVQVGTETLEDAEILGGIKEGEQVITTGARALRDGDPVVVAGGEGGLGRRGGGPPAGAAADGPSVPLADGGQPTQGGRRGATGQQPPPGDAGIRFGGEGRRGRRSSTGAQGGETQP